MPTTDDDIERNYRLLFWDQFENILPDAVRCKFFSTAMGVANGRAQEYMRESGYYLPAVVSTHLPTALRRLRLLKTELERLTRFYPEDDWAIRHRDRLRAKEVIGEASRIVAMFEQNIVVPLDEVSKSTSEDEAKKVIETLRKTALEIARLSESHFDRIVEKVEQGVSEALVSVKSLNGFVSCVSLDLAQYGAHTRVLHDIVGAEAIFALNEGIFSKILSILSVQEISSNEVAVIDTGDGAILVFSDNSSPEGRISTARACTFSESFLRFVAAENVGKAADNQLHFRVGICSGVIAGEHCEVRKSEIYRCRVGGLPLGTAVRLQAAARTGEIVACSITWQKLSSETQRVFKNQEEVYGKIHEKAPIKAHRFACVPPRPEERSSFS